MRSIRPARSSAGILLAALCLVVAAPCLAADGPGFGNLTYGPSELFQPISVLTSPWGHGNVALVNGYIESHEAATADGLADRFTAMVYRLRRRFA